MGACWHNLRFANDSTLFSWIFDTYVDRGKLAGSCLKILIFSGDQRSAKQFLYDTLFFRSTRAHCMLTVATWHLAWNIFVPQWSNYSIWDLFKNIDIFRRWKVGKTVFVRHIILSQYKSPLYVDSDTWHLAWNIFVPQWSKYSIWDCNLGYL